MLVSYSENVSKTPTNKVMSETMGRSSSVSSISLLEVKAESRLVLQAFLQRTLTVPFRDRPGWVGGTYKDPDQYSVGVKPKVKGQGHAEAEDKNSPDEKKTGLKNLMKHLPRRNSPRSSANDGKSSLEKEGKLKAPNVNQLSDEDVLSSSSSSEEEKSEKKQTKLRKNIKRKMSKFFKIKIEKDKEKIKEGHESLPHRPSKLKLDKTVESPTPNLVSPNVHDDDLMVQQLVQVLSVEGDSMNDKIQTDPFLRSSLARLSYNSFSTLLDTVSQLVEVPVLLPTQSPTLQRMAVTMKVSRQIVTATGAQRMQVFAQNYMENFAPWVKHQGGWENVAEMRDPMEYD
ncbi:uncharacterized protein bcl2l12 isoform X2 [Nerophis ophidion]|uniref:uncharacterized protein bcl2l12 isoform X2 n=1 Tax=Nerophis ophidion TaxID=159077 RepID=UPI002ADF5E5D|nr:uncharacterized protein bcl2l12 isoform X2 [Nerophis ophidion]